MSPVSATWTQKQNLFPAQSNSDNITLSNSLRPTTQPKTHRYPARPASAIDIASFNQPSTEDTNSFDLLHGHKNTETAQCRLDTIAKQLEYRLRTQGVPSRPKLDPIPVGRAAFGIPSPSKNEEQTELGKNKWYLDTFAIGKDAQDASISEEDDFQMNEVERFYDPLSKSKGTPSVCSSSLVHQKNIEVVNRHMDALVQSRQNEYTRLASELYLKHVSGEEKDLRRDGKKSTTPSINQLQEAYNIARLREPNVFQREMQQPGEWRHNAKKVSPEKSVNRTFLTTFQLGITNSKI